MEEIQEENYRDFTPEEIAYFRRIFDEAEEEQRRNGNKTYTPEEIEEMFKIKPEEIELAEKIKAEKIKNEEKIYTEEEINEILGRKDILENKLLTSLQEEEWKYNKN